MWTIPTPCPPRLLRPRFAALGDRSGCGTGTASWRFHVKPDTGRGLREAGKQHRPRRWVEHFGLLPCAVGVPESRVIATRKRVPPRQAPLGCTVQHPTHPQVLSTYQQEPARPLLAWQGRQQPQLMDNSSSLEG